MHAGTCKYFTGVGLGSQKQRCDKGVEYRLLVGGPDSGWVMRTPCFKEHKTDVKCDLYEEPSAEEIAAFEKMIAEQIRQMDAVEPLISAAKKKFKNKGGQEVVECPVCKGKLHLSVASVNGHCWGKCETPDCLAWME